MPRTEKTIMSGWEFALKNVRPEEEDFKEIILPHDWAVNAPFNKEMEQGDAQGYRDRWGMGWYRKKIFVDKKQKDMLYFLDFGGIYENSTIWVNNRKAGGWKYGYSSFRVDITDYVEKGDNDILIRVDNTQRPVDRWYSGCGIYRTVKLIELEQRHFDEREIEINTKISGENAIVTINTGTDACVKGSLSNTDTYYHEESKNGLLTFHVKNVKLWSADEPQLYKLKLELADAGEITDQISMNIGIREITMEPNKGMFVNGKLVKIKGVCLHQEVGCRGIAAKKEIWRTRLKSLKEMGCNAIRASHHIFAEEFLDLCDEMGFYVYEECFDKWTGGLYGRYFATEWEKDIECMVKRDRNRPSIFIWGVGNEVENQGQDTMLGILKMFREKVLTLDKTRPITCAMNPHFKYERDVDLTEIEDIQQFVDVEDDWEITDLTQRVKRIQKIAQYVDVIACNYQEQWYDQIHEAIPDKLILGTEIYQFFKGHPEQLQNYTIENPSLVPTKYNYVIGGMVWTGIDYMGESMGYPAKGWSGACIRTNGEKKPSYYLLQSFWSDKPMVHFSVMDYSLNDEGVKEHWDMPMYADHWHFPQFHKTVIPYMIATNCEEVELFLNGKRYYLSAPNTSGSITGFLPWQPGCVKVIGYKNGTQVCTYETITPGAAVKLEFDTIDAIGEMEDSYEILLTVRARDESGNPYFRESTLVSFQAEGDVEIVAVDNGNLMSNEPYGERSIHMFHGCASVLVRVYSLKEGNAVLAFAEGMQLAKINIR